MIIMLSVMIMIMMMMTMMIMVMKFDQVPVTNFKVCFQSNTQQLRLCNFRAGHRKVIKLEKNHNDHQTSFFSGFCQKVLILETERKVEILRN